MSIWLVMLGGAAGAIVRYTVGLGIAKLIASRALPVATMAINLTGSFGLGLLLAWQLAHAGDTYSDMLALLLGTGFFGAYTTFSTFSVEVLELWRKRRFRVACLYVCCTFAGCVAALAAGYALWNLLL